MPLVVANLSSALVAAMSAYPKTVAEAADAFATAYAAYAQQGTFLAGVMPSVEPQRAILMATLHAAMSAYGPSSTYANAWASGLSAFWVGIPVTGVNSGSTVGCPGASAAAAAILASLTALPRTIEQAANELAMALDTATRTVTATVLVPPAPMPSVVPIL